MKKVLSVLLALMTLSLTACSGGASPAKTEAKAEILPLGESKNLYMDPFFLDDSIIYYTMEEGEGVKAFAVNSEGEVKSIENKAEGRIISTDKSWFWVDKQGENIRYLMETNKETNETAEATIIGDMISPIYLSDNLLLWAENTNDAYNIKRYNIETGAKDNLTTVPTENSAALWNTDKGTVATGYTDYVIKKNCITAEDGHSANGIKMTLDIPEKAVAIVSDGENFFWGTGKGLFARNIKEEENVQLTGKYTGCMTLINGKTLVFTDDEGAFTYDIETKAIAPVDFGSDELTLATDVFVANDARTKALFTLKDNEGKLSFAEVSF